MNYLDPCKRNLYRIIIKTNNKVKSFKRLNKKNIVATGGEITDIIDNGIKYRVHTFKSSGNFEVLSGNDEVEYLIVAGGGGGASNFGNGTAAGGGGAGGYRSNVKGELSGGNSQPESLMMINRGIYKVILWVIKV